MAVYTIGGAGRGGATPVRLALAGTALTAALTAVIYGVALSDARLLQQYNHWSVGALGGRGRTSSTRSSRSWRSGPCWRRRWRGR